jgi:hypothetical protein
VKACAKILYSTSPTILFYQCMNISEILQVRSSAKEQVI